jgi:hypothetical protein
MVWAQGDFPWPGTFPRRGVACCRAADRTGRISRIFFQFQSERERAWQTLLRNNPNFFPKIAWVREIGHSISHNPPATFPIAVRYFF